MVPSDPGTLETVVRASIETTPYADAVAAATDAADWDVRTREELTIDNLSATVVEATALTEAAGIPVGTARFAYYIDVRSAGTLSLWTSGAAADEAYATQAGVVTLMMALSVVEAPS